MPERTEPAADQEIATVPPGTTPPSRRAVWLLGIVATAVLLIDLVSKLIVVAELRPGHSPRILGGAVYFSLTRNPGAAFGVAGGMTVIFALLAAVMIIAIIRTAPRLNSLLWGVSLGLLLGGAAGNLSDRIFRSPSFLRGEVVDFISAFGPDGDHYPIFNLADSAITIGVVLLVVTSLFGIGIDGRRGGRTTTRKPTSSG